MIEEEIEGHLATGHVLLCKQCRDQCLHAVCNALQHIATWQQEGNFSHSIHAERGSGNWPGQASWQVLTASTTDSTASGHGA